MHEDLQRAQDNEYLSASMAFQSANNNYYLSCSLYSIIEYNKREGWRSPAEFLTSCTNFDSQ